MTVAHSITHVLTASTARLTGAAAAVARDREDDGVLIDRAAIPGGGGDLLLVRYGEDHEILFGDEQLMGSWASLSEQALATLVIERLAAPAPHILIGGLGMGFTLAAARKAAPADATIVVSELVPKVVEWARGPLAHLFGVSLADPRVTIELRDIHDVVLGGAGAFDAILLDVDNGPDGLINAGNERLYCDWGLRALRAALRPGGILGIWSAYKADAFRKRLAATGFEVEEVSVVGDPTKPDYPDVIWLATRVG